MRSMPLDLALADAERIDLTVELPGGQLDIEEGMPGRVGGGFAYDHEDMEPVVESDVRDRTLRLSIRAPGWRTGIGPTTNLWRIRLPPGLPAAIALKVGSGRVVLHRGRFAVERFQLEQGFGEALVDLSAAEPVGQAPVTLRLGTAGRVDVALPGRVPLRVRARKAVGTLEVRGLEPAGEELWTNAAFEEGIASAFDVTLVTGAGEVTIRATGGSGG